MEKKLSKLWWLPALVIIATVFLSFVVVVAVFNFLLYGRTLVIPLILVFSGVIVGFAIYKGYKDRQTGYVTATFCIVGVILVLLGSMVEVPYTVRETFRKDSAKDFTYGFVGSSLSDRPAYQNGSLREIILPPSSTKKYCYEPFRSWFYTNKSIFQFNMSRSDLAFQIVELSYYDHKILRNFFNGTSHAPSYPIFWTPPDEIVEVLGLIFGNPSDEEVIFSFRALTYNLKSTSERQVINYQTPLDSNFAYIGVGLIGIAAVLEIYPFRRSLRDLWKKLL